ncbi:hypothetical protein [Nocardioides sp. WS12]|uniref:hypothetical protein n=1 Tax=Nocardioides sp. WS12 TaxID=2486272 RepID=UPI0015F9639B|nr:hypothetical protein [Nocardioides sp. WS12]
MTSLRAERDALARRCADAEAEVRRLGDELTSARAQIAAQIAAQVAAESEAGSLSLFDGDAAGDRLTGDGSDPRVLSLILGATAVVAGMVTLLAMLNGKLGSIFGLAMLALTVGLAWGAARTRIVPIEVEVVRGVVYVKHGESTHRFDVKKPDTQVLVFGRPGESDWAVHFPRRGMDPFVIDASMVDPQGFLRELREYRPEI